jgi:hypothetical protein
MFNKEAQGQPSLCSGSIQAGYVAVDATVACEKAEACNTDRDM